MLKKAAKYYWQNFWQWTFKIGLYDLLIPGAYDDSLVKTIEKFNLPEESKVADIGCGSGRLLLHFASAMKEKKYQWTGVDRARAGLEAAKHKAQKLGLVDQITLVEADYCEGIDIEDGSQDAAAAHFTLYVIGDRDKRIQALSNIKKLLKPEGFLILGLPKPSYNAKDIVKASVEINKQNNISITKRFFNLVLIHPLLAFFEKDIAKRISSGAWAGFTKEDLTKEVEQAGMKVEWIVDTYGGTSHLAKCNAS